MTNGSSQGLFVIVAVVIFGIFVLISYILFKDNLKPALANIFTDGLEQATTTLNNGTQSGAEGVTYEEWVEDLENQGYVVAEDTDFDGDVDGEFIYKGTDEKVIVPEIIKGVTITSGKEMFSKNTPVEAVAINNPNLIDMSYMFHNNPSTSLDVSNLVTENAWNMEWMFSDSKAPSLDVSSFDTSKVTNMRYMFSGSKATSLDLSSFDTSNVSRMARMFAYSKATSLDLSSFDTSNVPGTGTGDMFKLSQATTAYARTLADANKFNSSTGKPTALIFVVK